MPTSRERVFTFRFALVVTSGLCYFMALGVLLPVVPLFVKHDLGGNDVAVGVAVGAFSLGAVILRPFAGRIGDRFGRRLLIIGGGLIVGSAGLLYLLASALVPLVAVRVLAGVGEAAFFVGAASMVTDLAPEARRGEAISYWSIAVYGGLAFGPLLGNVLLDGDHYDRVWLASASLAFIAGALGLFTREVVTLDRAPGTPRPPLISRAALAPGAVLFLGLIGLAGFIEFVPLDVLQIGMDDSSAVFLLYGCLILTVRIFGARVPDRIGPLKAGTIATGTTAAGLLIMAAFAEPAGLFAGTIVFSIGMSFLYPAMLLLALTGLADNERGAAVGTTSSFFDLSQGIGALVLGIVAALTGYRGAFVAGALLGLAALVLLRSTADRGRKPDPDTAALARASVEPDLR
jgi:MFS family permease